MLLLRFSVFLSRSYASLYHLLLFVLDVQKFIPVVIRFRQILHPEVTRNLTSAQHDSGDVIICATHVHLNHSTCLECVITKGLSQDIQHFIEALRKIRGIKSLNINVTAEL